MKVEITKEDLEPLMWLQTGIEQVLLREEWDQWSGGITVSYTKSRGGNKYYNEDKRSFNFTLAEALCLAMKE